MQKPKKDDTILAQVRQSNLGNTIFRLMYKVLNSVLASWKVNYLGFYLS